MKKFLKNIILGFLAFIVLNAIVAAIYGYPTYKSIKNKTNKNFLKWDAIHSNENTFEAIIIGTSRTYTSFNPMIIDSVLGTNSYNMATSAQDIAETYFSLEEILEYQKPKYIILDLFFQSSDNNHDYFQIYSNSSFFNSNKRRFNLITEGYGSTGILNYSIPIVKFKNYIKQDISVLFSKKDPKINEDTWLKGYLDNSSVVNQKQISNFEAISNFENTDFNKKRFNTYFQKIKELVNSKDAKLICVRTPYPPSRLKLSDKDDEGEYFKSYMKASNIPFYDLNNYMKNEFKYLDEDFADFHHPNNDGANKASLQLSEILKQTD